MFECVFGICTTAAMTTAIAGNSTVGRVMQTFDERTGVFGIALPMFGTSALAPAAHPPGAVRQRRGGVLEAERGFRRRATD
jgi:hypothetical protein